VRRSGQKPAAADLAGAETLRTVLVIKPFAPVFKPPRSEKHIASPPSGPIAGNMTGVEQAEGHRQTKAVSVPSIEGTPPTEGIKLPQPVIAGIAGDGGLPIPKDAPPPGQWCAPAPLKASKGRRAWPVPPLIEVSSVWYRSDGSIPKRKRHPRGIFLAA